MGEQQKLKNGRLKPDVQQAKQALRAAAARGSGIGGLIPCTAPPFPVRCGPWVLVGSAAAAGVLIGMSPGALPALLRGAAGAGASLLGKTPRR
jgi:hypothetical protein